ncbi:MAG TPA: hypothetical protein VNL15_05105, partial [Dehalococcoidia bacterium]|nr:hypothetical protein [Dehalococcoidia bacterium]
MRRISEADEPTTQHEDTVVNETVHEPGPATVAHAGLSSLRNIVAWALLVVEALLAFRLGFLLAGANPGNNFVDFIYDVTAPLVAPFDDIASDRAVDGGVFEPGAAIAMAVYLVAAVLLIVLLR